MRWIGLLFTVAIPVASFLWRMIVNLTGGYRVPLAWTFSYYVALSISFLFSFTFARVETAWKHKAKAYVLGALLSLCIGTVFGIILSHALLGTTFGSISSQAGVVKSPYEAPSRSWVIFTDAIFCSIAGIVSGLGLGLGNASWVKFLAKTELSLEIALAFCLSIAILSVSLALSASLLE